MAPQWMKRAARNLNKAWLLLALTLAACSGSSGFDRTGVNSFTSPKSPTIALTQPAQLNGGNGQVFCPVLLAPQVFDLKEYPQPALDQPTQGVSFHDPTYGLCMARLSDFATDRLPADGSRGLNGEGAAVQPFNSDGTLALARSEQGYWYVYSTTTLQLVETLPIQGDIEVRWDPLDASSLYTLEGSVLFHTSLKDGKRELLHNFALDFPQMAVARVETHHMGSFSADNRTLPLIAVNSGGQALAVVLYDLITDQIIASEAEPAETALLGVMVSPLGQHVLVWYEQNCQEDIRMNGGVPACGLVAYDRQMRNPRWLLPSVGAADVALAADGREVLVYHDVRMNSISMLDLESGEPVSLWLIDMQHTPLHINISAQARGVPGWALVSTFGAGNGTEGNGAGASWMANSIFAIELAPQGRVARLANTYTAGAAPEWFPGPRAAANNAFTQILFASNWGRSGEGEMEIYLIGLPEGWVDGVK